MSEKIETTFDSIESAHEFVTLLATSVAQAKREIEADVTREQGLPVSRRLDALRLALYTLAKLDLHMSRSRCALNDLRTLRRLLFEERTPPKVAEVPGLKTKTATGRARPPVAKLQTGVDAARVARA